MGLKATSVLASRFFLGKRAEDTDEEGPHASQSQAVVDTPIAAPTDGALNFNPETDPQEQSDADLEASVLDTLTDTVLTGIRSHYISHTNP